MAILLRLIRRLTAKLKGREAAPGPHDVAATLEARTFQAIADMKRRKAAEHLVFVEHGVTLPRAEALERKDAFLAGLEQRMQEQQQRFTDQAQRLEQQEQYRLRDLRDQEEKEREAAERRELELARIEADREAVLALAKALHQDMG